MIVSFQIDEAGGQDSLISDVKTKFASDGKHAEVKYSMPYHEEYRYCVIFDVSEEEYSVGVSLPQLIGRKDNIDIIDGRMPHDHTVALSRDGKRCIFFAARRKGDVYYLRNQSTGNISECLKIQPTIRCAVRYEDIRKGFLKLTSSQEQKAILKIGGDRPLPGTYLIYRCRGGGREGTRFGIDAAFFWGKELEITIKKEEKIELISSDDKSYLLKMI